MHDVLSPRAASKNNPVDRSVNDRLLPSFALNQLHLVTEITPLGIATNETKSIKFK